MTESLTFRAVAEPEPGPQWQALFQEWWPAYSTWFLMEGNLARPTYGESLRALKTHMPELVPTYERLCELAGGGDLAARCLALYCPPPYLAGCSQLVWSRDEPVLIRNYDYRPDLCDATVLDSRWCRRVMGMLDCMWGVLDGMNADGLAVALAFGGRNVVGHGFGIPLILRYVLETCTRTAEAVAALVRVPVHMAYNVSVVDAAGEHRTVFLAPDREPLVRTNAAVTNHQEGAEWVEYARVTATVERERYLNACVADAGASEASVLERFFEPPLYQAAFAQGWGTLYTAVYRPRSGELLLRWPVQHWRQSFATFQPGELKVAYHTVVKGESDR